MPDLPTTCPHCGKPADQAPDTTGFWTLTPWACLVCDARIVEVDRGYGVLPELRCSECNRRYVLTLDQSQELPLGCNT